MKNFRKYSALLSLTVLLFSHASQAVEVDSVFVRAKAGSSFYSNINSVTSVFGMGFDLGFRSTGGFGVVGTGTLNFSGSGTDTSSPNTTIYTEVKSLYLGVNPSYSVNKGLATLSFGLGVGVLSVTTQVTTTIPSLTTISPDSTKSRFALAPNFEVDFEIVSNLFANVGVQYVAAFGESPKPSFISTMAGVGYHF